MINFLFDYRGFAEMQRGFEKMSAALDGGEFTARATPLLVEAMRPMESAVKAEAPARTGEARGGIHLGPGKATPRRARAWVMQTVRHGIHVDLGHMERRGHRLLRVLLGRRHRQPDPYMQRAADRTQRQVLDDASEDVARLVEDMARE